ncbi:MAG TPA: hypothetical protein VM513_25105 [Kofleriaceae bacterium]|nr:hypothetical protein [Kofleriaceae bacterium]
MHSTTLVAALALFLPGSAAVFATPHPSLPSLSNFEVLAVATSDDLSAQLPDDTLGTPDGECSAGARVTLGLTVDLGEGRQHVVASYAGGIAVFDAEAMRLAGTPGYPCAGSADELEVLAVGNAFGVPTVAAVLTTGGRREAVTWLGLYRVGFGGRLEAVFAGAIEHRDGDRVLRGNVTLLPKALLHREPTGEVILWTWDDGAGVYVPRPALEPIPHS